MKTGMQPAMMVSLSLRVLAESPGRERQKVALRMRSMILLQAACSTLTQFIDNWAASHGTKVCNDANAWR